MVVLGVHDKVGRYEAAGCSSEKRKVNEIFAWYDWTDVELVSLRARARGVAGRLASLDGLEALLGFLTNRKRCKIGVLGHPPPRLAWNRPPHGSCQTPAACRAHPTEIDSTSTERTAL